MLTTRNMVLAGAAVVLAIGGAIYTPIRENNSPCGEDFYTGRVHDEMRAELIEESQYLKALEAGAVAEDISAADRATYRQAAQLLRDTIAETEVVGTMKHPNNSDLKNCHLRLAFSDVLADFDLGQRTTLGFAVDRDFEIVSRFEIRFENIPGTELQSRIEKQRDQWLVGYVADGEYVEGDVPAGTLVESARIAKLTRREFDIKEPEFIELNYNTSFETEGTISDGFFGDE